MDESEEAIINWCEQLLKRLQLNKLHLFVTGLILLIVWRGVHVLGICVMALESPQYSGKCNLLNYQSS